MLCGPPRQRRPSSLPPLLPRQEPRAELVEAARPAQTWTEPGCPKSTAVFRPLSEAEGAARPPRPAAAWFPSGGRATPQSVACGGSSRCAMRCPDSAGGHRDTAGRSASPRVAGCSGVGSCHFERHGARSETPRQGRGSGASATPRDVIAKAVEQLDPRRSTSGSKRGRRTSHVDVVKAVYLDIGNGGEFTDGSSSSKSILPDLGNCGPSLDVRVQREVAAIRTGEDAINFFTKYQDGTEVKLLYLVRRQTCGEGDEVGPYDLEVACDENIQQEYFTISASGIVHFRAGQLSECTPLAEWLHQSTMYRVLSAVPFFRLFQQRRCLTHWRASARYSAYCQLRRVLAHGCLFARPSFAGQLGRAHAHACDIQAIALVSPPEGHCQLAAFEKAQQHAVAEAQHALEGRQEEIESDLANVVKRLAQAAEAKAPSQCPAIYTLGKVRSRPLSKSMAQEREEAQRQVRFRRALQWDSSRFGDCVRLVELMLRASVVVAVARCAARLRTWATGVAADAASAGAASAAPGPVSGGIFLLAVEMNGEGALELSPTKDELVDSFEGILRNIEDFASSANWSFSARGKLGPHLHSESGTRMPQEQRPLRSVHGGYRANVAEVFGAIRGASHEAKNLANETYARYARIHRYGAAWSETAFAAQQHSYEDVAGDLQLMRDFDAELQPGRFRMQRSAGRLLVLDARNLRERLAAVPNAALPAMKRALAAIARDTCAAAVRRLDTARLVSSMVRPFELTRGGSETDADNPRAVEAQLERVQAMYRLLKDFNVKVGVEEEVGLDALQALSARQMSSTTSASSRRSAVVAPAPAAPRSGEGSENGHDVRDGETECPQASEQAHAVAELTTSCIFPDAMGELQRARLQSPPEIA